MNNRTDKTNWLLFYFIFKNVLLI